MDDIRRKQYDANNGVRDDVKVRDIKDWLRKNPGFAASVAAESIKNRRAEVDPVRAQLLQANDFLRKISDTLSDTLFVFSKSLLGLNGVPVGATGNIRDEDDRQSMLDIMLDSSNYKTAGQAATQDISASIRNAFEAVTTKRGWSDIILGAPEEGSWRAQGRDYEDARAQYRSDRWLQDQADGPDKGRLIKQYGSKEDADKAIDTEFAQQQRIAVEAKGIQAEIDRRRKLGMVDEEIDSEAGGKLITKLTELITLFGRYQPTRAGKYLSDEIEPGHEKLKEDDEHFNANESVHKDYKTTAEDMARAKEPLKVFKINPARAEVQEAEANRPYNVLHTHPDRGQGEQPFNVFRTNPAREYAQDPPNVFKINPARGQEVGESTQEVREEDLRQVETGHEIQKEQAGILTEIRATLAEMLAVEKDIAEAEEDKDEPSLMDDLKTIITTIMEASIVRSVTAAVMPLLGPALGVAAAGAAGVGAGMLINKGWESATGNTIGSSLYNVFGESEEVKNINKPVDQATIDAYRAKKNLPIPVKPVAGPKTAERLDQSRQTVEAMRDEKKEKDKSATMINAPTTVNQSVTNNTTGGGGMLPIRNPDSSVSNYIKTRYHPG